MALGSAPAKAEGTGAQPVEFLPQQAEKRGEGFVLAGQPEIKLESRAHKMSKARGNVVNPDAVVRRIRRRFAAALRDVHGPAGSHQALEHGRRERRAGFLDRVWRMIIDERARRWN